MKKTTLAPLSIRELDKMENTFELNELELQQTNGGDTPSKNTSIGNDIVYYAGQLFWNGLSIFSSGASKGK